MTAVYRQVRHRRALAVALAGLLVVGSTVLPPPAVEGAAAPALPPPRQPSYDSSDPHAACRSWTNQWQPPPTIRVYRTRGPAAGRVQTVSFRAYVAVVMAAEWPAAWPREVLRAGALAAKQYAWYYSVFYRGWLAPDGRCFHVMDTSTDQVYNPERHNPHQRHLDALEATWMVSVRRPRPRSAGSQLILTSYRTGRTVACGADADGLKLFQRSAAACAAHGMGMKQILRTYYGRNLEFVDVRQHRILADPAWRGTAAVLAGRAGSGRAEWRLYRATAGSFRSAVSGRIQLELDNLLDSAAADVTGNGLADLVLLVRTGQMGRRLLVLQATGSGYGQPHLWASWREESAADGRQLLLADFTGDGLADAGMLKAVEDRRSRYKRATLRVMAALNGGGFGRAVNWWTGGFDPRINVALAGDVTGNGRADLIVRQDRGSNGLRFWVMSALPVSGLRAPRLWLERRDWRAETTIQLVIDENRDGRDDLFVIRRLSERRVAVDVLRSNSGGQFSVTSRWRTPSGASMNFARLRPTALHVDNDGRGDLALFERTSNGRTRVYWLRTTDNGMQLGRALVDGELRWREARVY